MNNVLVVVDLQMDFLDKIRGKSPVVGGLSLVKPINKLIDAFVKAGDHVVFVNDAHPRHHVSFKTVGEHCIANSEGALLHKDLHIPTGKSVILTKGTDRREDATSAFSATDGFFPLEHFLEDWNVGNVFVVGIGLEGCVHQTAAESLSKGFSTFVVTDACRAKTSVGYKQTLQELPKLGVYLVLVKDAIKLAKSGAVHA